jgi:hypothetical protein
MTNTFPATYKTGVLGAIDTLDLKKVGQAIDLLRQARENGRRILVCGNGGRASTASHFVCDIVKGASFGRENPFRIMALTDSLPTITAYSNDVSYECIFAEQLKTFAGPGDVVDGNFRIGELAQRAARGGVRNLGRVPDDRAHGTRRGQIGVTGAVTFPGGESQHGTN